MTSDETERAAMCAAFLGWTVGEREFALGDGINKTIEHYKRGVYYDAIGIRVVGSCEGYLPVSDYNPFANTRQGREQANDLWKRLDDDGIEWNSYPEADGTKIFKIDPDRPGPWICGEGPTWNAALAAAVAKLQEGKK